MSDSKSKVEQVQGDEAETVACESCGTSIVDGERHLDVEGCDFCEACWQVMVDDPSCHAEECECLACKPQPPTASAVPESSADAAEDVMAWQGDAGAGEEK